LNSHFLTLLAESRQPLLKRTDSKYSTIMRFQTTNNAVHLSRLYSQMDFSALNISITVCSIAVAYLYKSFSFIASREPATAMKKN
jgi:hypothetical protein